MEPFEFADEIDAAGFGGIREDRAEASMPFFWPKDMNPTCGSMVQNFLPVLARRPGSYLPVGAYIPSR